MLCQTQVSRVIVYYNQWMKLFPSVEVLAQATNTEVLSARSGLGYNSRGLRVKQSAEKIVNGWKFPTTYEDLISLPGVGDYVASAILAFAYNQDIAVIDTNIRRILIHQYTLDEKTSLKDLKILALEILPRGYAREWYNALMDYGALELTAKRSGIRPTTRQSKFEGSRRQVRAWIVKEIINYKWWIINDVVVVSQNVGADIIRPLTILDISHRFPDRDDIQSIVDDLLKENVIEIENTILKIKN